MNTETECERVLAYMSERYGDSFTCPVFYGGYPGAPVHQYYLDSEKLGDTAVKVEVRGHGTPQERYLDNYMGVQYGPLLKEAVAKLLASSFFCEEGDLYLSIESAALGLSDRWTPETTFEEYSSDPAAGICFRAVVRTGEDFSDPIEREETEKWLEEDLKTAGLCCTGWIYFVPWEADLDGLAGEAFYDRIIAFHSYDARLFFNMKTADRVDTFAWEGGWTGPEEAAVTAADGND